MLQQKSNRNKITDILSNRKKQRGKVGKKEGREGVKWEPGLALLWTGKMGFTHWDWDLATGNGMNNYKMGMGFLFFSGLCSNILK